MKAVVRGVLVGVTMAAMVGLGPTGQGVEATPLAVAEYVETSLGGGQYQYDYVVRNESDPILDAGVDLYDFFLTYSTGTTLVTSTVPTDWDFIGGVGFFDAFSLVPGAYPVGSDIGPGQSLGIFRLVFDGQVGPAAFQALFVNPLDAGNPVLFEGTTSAVPEPTSIILLGTALVVPTLKRRMKRYGKPT